MVNPAERRPLLQRIRAAGSDLPHLPLADLPTPLGQLQFAGLPAFWLKNDGAAAPVYGGNKVRKLEWLLAEAKTEGASTVRTTGAIGSNHCVATAIHASRVGLRTELFQTPQPLTEHVRLNMLAASCFAHRTRLLPDYRAFDGALRRAGWVDRLRGRRSKAIPMGGSSVTGTLGYVNAALEFCEQLMAERGAPPPRIYLPAGTCGTMAGLIVGFELAEREVEVVGVRVVDASVTNDARVAELVEATWHRLQALGLARPARRVAWMLRHDGFGAGYGVGTEAGAEAVARFAEHGLKLELTYTAKAAAVLLRDLRSGQLRDGEAVFWYTLNSQPLLAALPHDALTRVPADYKPFFEVPR